MVQKLMPKMGSWFMPIALKLHVCQLAALATDICFLVTIKAVGVTICGIVSTTDVASS